MQTIEDALTNTANRIDVGSQWVKHYVVSRMLGIDFLMALETGDYSHVEEDEKQLREEEERFFNKNNPQQ